MVTRLHAVKDYLHHTTAHHILPNAGDLTLLVDLASENWIGAVKLEYMAVPKRSLAGTMPFNPQQGMGNNENLLFRALAALPLLFLIALRYCRPLSAPKALLPWQMLLSESFDVPFLNLKVADFGTIYAVILIESARRANLMTPPALPSWFGLGCQLAPAEMFLSLYFFTYEVWRRHLCVHGVGGDGGVFHKHQVLLQSRNVCILHECEAASFDSYNGLL
ncbi:FAD binding domain protein [Metarhizium album ARSEF 1941]|uniref:FAD binding domain protein n=1 Tax=Metarhizium album (strain ARSEF 1941) TaxID=1081103 RepID=A0A0B2WIY1_METAS|nr:FAD binding domain protein [Metarhizium album ARSEF 1941]KHN93793.1 FAD binding domain protein [Metarhizium album ARSEF 1941]